MTLNFFFEHALKNWSDMKVLIHQVVDMMN